MNFIYQWQDVSISLDRMNEIHTQQNEEDEDRHVISLPENNTNIHRLPQIHPGSKVTIDDPLAGFIEATVSETSKEPTPTDGRQREVTIRFTSAERLHSGDVMDGRIILSDVPVLQRILQSVGIGR